MTRVLLVDDEPEIIFLATKMLEKDGHKVTGVRSSDECFEKLKEETFDLILMDVMMPHDDGWESCRKIKGDEKTCDIPLAMFTVRSSEDSVEKSNVCGADAHINKPFYRAELLETVENLIKESKS